jgi:hypothetical protein
LKGSAEVDELMAILDHPLKPEIERVREVILGVSPEIGERIKWKSPSFFKGDYFATVNLRSLDELHIIFHLGAKVKELPEGGITIDDSTGMVKWLAKDRALVTPRGQWDDLNVIVRQWIGFL